MPKEKPDHPEGCSCTKCCVWRHIQRLPPQEPLTNEEHLSAQMANIPPRGIDAAIRMLPSTPAASVGAEVIAERAKIRAPFETQAKYSQSIKVVFRMAPNWLQFSTAEREALDNIANKLARMLTGDPHELDNWVDIAGYSELIIKNLKG